MSGFQDKIKHLFKTSRLVRFFSFFGMILIIFFVIEILPLHYGSKQLPWHEIVPLLRAKLPRILLIAAGASLFIVYQASKKSEDSP
ncbi:MAG: hypothetical protein GF398_00670 [Chitinivibrionales bacterium]|nr:hypothetical protein [Chitinivibrionales bacterium]